MVGELERPETPGGVSPVAIRTVQQATAPVSPSSSGLLAVLIAGLFGGLIIGIAAALARASLDISVSTPEDLAKASSAPNLGLIPFDSTTGKNPVTFNRDAQSPRSEAYRQVRTNLQFLDGDKQQQVVLFTSSVAGEGKSTTVANVAIALGYAGQRVLCIEGDLRRPGLSQVLGLDRSVGLTSVLAGRLPLPRATQSWGGGAFEILASGPIPPNPSELLASKQMSSILDECRARYDIVLIDTSPVLPVTDAVSLAPQCDSTVLVCRFKKTSQNQVATAVERLRAVSVVPAGTIMTMVPRSGGFGYERYDSYRSSKPQQAAGAQP